MANGRRSLRAVVLTLSAVWAITSCGLIDGFLDEGEDKGQDETGSALRPGRVPDDVAGPFAPGAGGSAMATGGAGRGGAAGNAGSASISAAGSAELPKSRCARGKTRTRSLASSVQPSREAVTAGHAWLKLIKRPERPPRHLLPPVAPGFRAI